MVLLAKSSRKPGSLHVSLSAALLCLILGSSSATAKHGSTAASQQSTTTTTTTHSSGHSSHSTRSTHSHSGHQSETTTVTHSGHSVTSAHSGHSVHSTHSSHASVKEPALHTGHSNSRRTSHVVEAAPVETRRVSVLVTDKHGRKHRVIRTEEVAHESTPSTHTVTKRVAVMVRDRHGRMHKVFKTETVEVATHESSAHKHSHSKVVDQEQPPTTVTKKDIDSGEPKPDGQEPERLNPSFGKSYALYDEGANARLSGNYALAIANLGRALAMVPANSRGGPSVLQLNMEYELAQAAEAQGDFALAARYYSRALGDRPNFTEAAVRLATVQARAGNYSEAMKTARAAVQRSPNDPRTHAILTVILEKCGSKEEAKIEKAKTKSLLSNIHSIDTAPLSAPDTVSPPVSTDPKNQSDPSMDEEAAAAEKKPEPQTTAPSSKSESSAPAPGKGGDSEMDEAK